MRRLASVVSLFTMFFAVFNSSAQQTNNSAVPSLIRYSGSLIQSISAAASSKVTGMTFAVYKQQEGGAPVWMETQNVTLEAGGHYSVLLGSTRAEGLPPDLFSAQEERWLGVQVESQPEQARVLLVSVPYAMKAAEADRLAGHVASEFVTTDTLQSAVKEQLQQQANEPRQTRTKTAGVSTNGTADPYVDNGTTLQVGANFNIGGSGSAATLNVTSRFLLGGTAVLGSNGVQSLFVGPGAGQSNSGILNTFLGTSAGQSNTTGSYNTFAGALSGLYNTTGSLLTFVGMQAGVSNTTGQYNSFVGTNAGLYNTTGSYNTFAGALSGLNNTTGSLLTFVGMQSGVSNTTGHDNSFMGTNAGLHNTTGSFNTFTGSQAGYNNTGDDNTFIGGGAGYNNNTGSFNTFIGNSAGLSSTMGSFNTFIGNSAGINNTTGQNNVYIANSGASESNTIRIGDSTHFAAYIAGIYGSTIGSGTSVFINSSGRLGTFTSSRRFKEQIRDMGDSTNGLMKLRPVTFLYKPEYDKGPRTLQYGLIAEEVAEVYPDLVAYEPDGKPYTVKYQYLTTMLLNELQKEHHIVEELKTQLQVQNAELKKQNEELQQRLARVEILLQSQMNSAIAQTASAGSLQPDGTRK